MEEEMKRNSTASVRVLTLLAAAFMGLVVTSVATVLAQGMSQYSSTMLLVLLQDVLVFILPALAIVQFYYKRPWHHMGLAKRPSLRALALVVIVYVVSLPALNYIVVWNDGLHLPQWMASVEEAMRVSEETARAMTSMLLSETSVPLMLVAVLVVGIMAGVSEEMFFRGGLLRMMRGSGNSHMAVWIVAIAFSAIHMQFFGFFPRMIMGAWLGYMLVWTRSLWVPIIAHALNNSMVVIATWMANVGYVPQGALDNLGVPQEGEFPWMALVSAIATAAVIAALRRSVTVKES